MRSLLRVMLRGRPRRSLSALRGGGARGSLRRPGSAGSAVAVHLPVDQTLHAVEHPARRHHRNHGEFVAE
eukprot:scaffold28410_cov55-Phaeocystis_antarctica.AAC.1